MKCLFKKQYCCFTIIHLKKHKISTLPYLGNKTIKTFSKSIKVFLKNIYTTIIIAWRRKFCSFQKNKSKLLELGVYYSCLKHFNRLPDNINEVF